MRFELGRLSPEGVDIFLDCLCGEECNRGYSLLKPMGKYILYGMYIKLSCLLKKEDSVTICLPEFNVMNK
jgi:NADPH-dependent curcumin reductase CurA